MHPTPEVRYRFSLSQLMLGTSIACGWLALFPISLELFSGAGLIIATCVWMRLRRAKFFRAGVFALHELLIVGSISFLGLSLILRFLADRFGW